MGALARSSSYWSGLLSNREKLKLLLPKSIRECFTADQLEEVVSKKIIEVNYPDTSLTHFMGSFFLMSEQTEKGILERTCSLPTKKMGENNMCWGVDLEGRVYLYLRLQASLKGTKSEGFITLYFDPKKGQRFCALPIFSQLKNLDISDPDYDYYIQYQQAAKIYDTANMLVKLQKYLKALIQGKDCSSTDCPPL